MDLRMNAASLINQTSKAVEYYTPPAIVEAARRVMGHIDLDPASSHQANKTVGADAFFDLEHDGLSRSWHGRVWLNHPFGRNANKLWIDKLYAEYEAGRVIEACCITYACTSESWFTPLLLHPQCFLVPRTNYLLPDGSVMRGVTKGSVVTYFGEHPSRFASEFRTLGVVKERSRFI